jgi:glycosyltransferase involved in cell wall biosynthesis
MGGAEFWMLWLARHCDPRVEFTAMGLIELAPTHTPVCRQVRRFMPIFATHELDKGGMNDQLYTQRIGGNLDVAKAALAEADVCIAWGMPDLVAMCEAPRFKGPRILVSHGACDWTRGKLRPAIPGATHFAAVSEAAVQPYPHNTRPAVRIMHNGAELDRLAPILSRTAVRAKWGLRPDEIAVGFVGRFSPEKRPVEIAKAVAALHAMGRPEFRAVFVGIGWQERLLREEIRGILGDAAIFAGEFEHVGDALQALDVKILATPSEGFAIGLIEAWLVGLPTVCTPVGAVPEIEREHGPICVRVPIDPTGEQLAAAVLQAVAPENAAIVQRARYVAWQHFTAAHMARRWADWIVEVAGTLPPLPAARPSGTVPAPRPVARPRVGRTFPAR